jgi:hygromycin-B 7''-O-kinase
MLPPTFTSPKEYSRYFSSLPFWRPYVEEACRRSGVPCVTVQPTLAGTYPVFRAGDGFIVKLFGDLFDGPAAYEVEREIFSLFSSHPSFPAPRMAAHGCLFPDQPSWRWPYIISTAIPGVSLGECASQVSYRDREGVALWLGPVVRDLHALPLGGVPILSPSWERFLRFLGERRTRSTADHRSWGRMPEHLVREIDRYLPPLEALIDRDAGPVLLHSDLNQDHVLGCAEEGGWQPKGIIDFGDAQSGDRLYELAALHAGLFHCDKRLLRIFLEAYGLERGGKARFVHRAMSMALLHEFDVLGPVFEEFPWAREAESLGTLAHLMWGLEEPELVGEDRGD